MSQLAREKVYTGFWVNHEKGKGFGSTITLDTNQAIIVVAILSLLCTFAATHLWNIVAFIYFSSRAVESPCEASHHQLQTILRNVVSPSTTLWKTLNMLWYWRRDITQKKSFYQLALVSLLATLCVIMPLVAGLVSSQIVSTKDIEVLAKSEYCGFGAESTDPTESDMLLSARYILHTLQESIRYAHDCYNTTSSDLNCRVFTTSAVPFASSYASCPFDDLCVLRENKALSMDTGLLWSDKVFGINFPPSDRLAMRMVTTCAPINVSEYQQTTKMDKIHANTKYSRDPLPGEDMEIWNLGAWPNQPHNTTMVHSSTLTYTLSDYTTNVAMSHTNSTELFAESGWYHGLSFAPIKPLQKTEADVMIISVLNNFVFYFEPVSDPIFAAETPFQVGGGLVNTTGRPSPPGRLGYHGNNLVTVVGCTHQHQFCIEEQRCTNLTHSISAANQALNLGLNDRQNVTLHSYANALINYSNDFSSFYWMDGPPLLASDLLWSNTLPTNQWELEVKYWKSIILTRLQKLLTDFAAGRGTPGRNFDNLPRRSSGLGEAQLCHAQKMKAPDGLSNISVFGLSLMIGISGLVILTNLTMVSIIRWLSRRVSKHWIFVAQWDREEILQLQRTAYEIGGIGNWFGGPHQVPITSKGERFRGLSHSISDPDDRCRVCETPQEVHTSPAELLEDVELTRPLELPMHLIYPQFRAV